MMLCPITKRECARDCTFNAEPGDGSISINCELERLTKPETMGCFVAKQNVSHFPDETQFWFPKSSLGILQGLLEETLNEPQKRKRAAAFRNLTRVLIGLKLLPEGLGVTRIAFGCSPLGEQGLLISTIQSTRVVSTQGNFAEERNKP